MPLVVHMFHHDRQAVISTWDLHVSVCASLHDLNSNKGKGILIFGTLVFSPRYALESCIVLYNKTNAGAPFFSNCSLKPLGSCIIIY